jgi:hypothetical protein
MGRDSKKLFSDLFFCKNGPKTLSKMPLSIMPLTIMVLSVMPLSIMPLSIMPLNIMSLSIMIISIRPLRRITLSMTAPSIKISAL